MRAWFTCGVRMCQGPGRIGFTRCRCSDMGFVLCRRHRPAILVGGLVDCRSMAANSSTGAIGAPLYCRQELAAPHVLEERENGRPRARRHGPHPPPCSCLKVVLADASDTGLPPAVPKFVVPDPCGDISKMLDTLLSGRPQNVVPARRERKAHGATIW